MIEKIDKIRDLLIVPSVDEQPKMAINQMKILNLLVELRAETDQLTTPGVVCCGVLEKMNLGWMKLEDGTKCMPYIKGHSDEVMYRINNCPSCGKYVRDVMI